jgi:hypothetical protein
MHEFRIKPLIDAVDVLVNVSAMIHSKHPRVHPTVGDQARQDVCKYLEEIVPQFAKSDLDLCCRGAERLLATLKKTDQANMIVSEIDDLRRRILDQADSTFCLLLTSQDRRLFEQVAPFGIDVETKFPSANNDIYEAYKCLALGRATACVMHLMRVCESGLTALAKALGVPRQNDWGSYLREIEAKLAAATKAAGKRSPLEQFYAEASIGIDNVRRAWRNPTMHIENSYSPERAEEILSSVRSLMRHLATRLSE